MTSATGVLASYQSEWLHILYTDKPYGGGATASLVVAVIRHYLHNPLAPLGLLMMPSMALVDTLLARQGSELLLSVRMLTGTTSCVVALFILRRRKPVVVSALRQVIAAAQCMEAEADDQGKALFAAEVRRSRLVLMKCYSAYAGYVFVGIAVGFVINHDTASSLWLHRQATACSCWRSWVALAGSWGQRLGGVYGFLGCVVSLFVVLCVELNMHSCCVELLREVGRRLKDAEAGRIGARETRRHIEVLAVCRRVNDMFGLMLPLYLMSSVIVAVISTAIVLDDESSRRWDPFTWGTMPQLTAIFVAQCIVGQRLQDASRGVSRRAYEGVWTDEAVPDRRHRLLIMASTARPASFTVAGLGNLNLNTCFRGLSVWFKYLQMLINLNYKKP